MSFHIIVYGRPDFKRRLFGATLDSHWGFATRLQAWGTFNMLPTSGDEIFREAIVPCECVDAVLYEKSVKVVSAVTTSPVEPTIEWLGERRPVLTRAQREQMG